MKVTVNENENKVLKSIAIQCYEDYSATVSVIALDTGLSINQVKGYVGSLVKKDVIYSDEDIREGDIHNDIWICFEGVGTISFGWDHYEQQEWDDMVNQLAELKVAA